MLNRIQVWVRRIYIKLRNFYLYMACYKAENENENENEDEEDDFPDMPVRPIQKPRAYYLGGKRKKSSKNVVVSDRVEPEKVKNCSYTVNKKYK